MTAERWRRLRRGDILVDRYFQDRDRVVFEVKRISGTRGQSDKTRVCLTVSNLKSRGAQTIVFVSDEVGLHRFEIKEGA